MFKPWSQRCVSRSQVNADVFLNDEMCRLFYVTECADCFQTMTLTCRRGIDGAVNSLLLCCMYSVFLTSVKRSASVMSSHMEFVTWAKCWSLLIIYFERILTLQLLVCCRWKLRGLKLRSELRYNVVETRNHHGR